MPRNGDRNYDYIHTQLVLVDILHAQVRVREYI